jgi:hypothetical protein
MKAYYDMARIIVEIGFTPRDQSIRVARQTKRAASKRVEAAGKALSNNPNNPRYKNDLESSTAKVRAASREARKPMTHEKDPPLGY